MYTAQSNNVSTLMPIGISIVGLTIAASINYT